MSLKPMDFAKAAGIGVAILVVNVVIAILVVLFYSMVIEPGHPREFYDEAALRIAPWCSHIAGTALFFAAGYLFTKTRPDRNGLLFALAFTGCYVIIDVAIALPMGEITIEFALSMLAKLVGGQAGAFIAIRNNWRPNLQSGN